MSNDYERVDPQELCAAVSASSFSQLIFFPEIDSTNRYAYDQSDDLPDRSLIVAGRQYAGRGRMGRVWQGDGDGVYFSLLLHPPLAPMETLLLPLLTAVAVAEGLEALGCQVYLKWPNDVVDADGKKLCGILTEMKADVAQLRALVIGVGVNVNQSSFEGEISALATSLFCISGGVRYRKVAVIKEIIYAFQARYNAFLAGQKGAVRDAWKQRCRMFGKPYWYKTTGTLCVPVDLDVDGSLVVRYNDGSIGILNSGEVVEVCS
ncbi:biotin--[acetyl-CoA-carboxylase] ligase [Chrysiogenes arsenatis]|uniref:biotin--[acetyl-CoA-carboxylase] ligase n=1 Tax=Chrysiogenes arsenatis TaxID=309797 RepID=UPI000422C7E3|nr:biotin--[acetyl-CoA-carboxylase] ligase [Chrysiogenes arsenatis]